ncbi:MAG: hypothetical protein R3B54_14005 [Bdellovibrionota bacterium]
MALPPVAPDEKATLEKAWDAAKQHFIEIMELGGESSLGIRLGKKEKRTSQEEALFQTYNKLKAKGDRPKDLDRLAKELYYLHTLEIAASYEYLRPIVAAPLIEQLIKANRENLPGMIKGKLLGDFKRLIQTRAQPN